MLLAYKFFKSFLVAMKRRLSTFHLLSLEGEPIGNKGRIPIKDMEMKGPCVAAHAL